MPAKPESKLQRQIQDAITEKYGASVYLFKMHGGPYSPAGVPDLNGCLYGYYFGIEVKMPGRERKATPQQLAHIARIERAGGVAGIVTSVSEALVILEQIEDAFDDRS